MSTSFILPVLLPLALEEPYAYLFTGEQPLAPGTFVNVPLGPRTRTGIVWGPPLQPGDLAFPTEKLRRTGKLPDTRPLTSHELKFIKWVAGYTLSPPGMVLRMMMSVPAVFESPKPQTVYRPTGKAPDRTTPKRQIVLEALAKEGTLSAARFHEDFQISNAVLRPLVEQGVLEKTESLPAPPAPSDWPSLKQNPRTLSPAQQEAVDALRQHAWPAAETHTASRFSVSLLDGVTGSGKTEVYFELVADCLERGRQTLIMLPEITLTGQFLNRFEERFGFPAQAWHSALTPATRRNIWKQVASGEAPIIIGARSALFLPYKNLGLIIVDEEHESAYKQEEGVRYQGRDMAVVKAHIEGIPALLCSATPSLESWVNMLEGRYHHVPISQRFTGSNLPQIDTIDLRAHPPERGKWISPVLVQQMKSCLEDQRQTLLFLNRRGYAPLTLCRKCGYRFECPDCSAWLVEHRFRHILTCHHCGHEISLPPRCPDCEAEDTLVPCGPGVERIAEEVRHLFPKARTALLSSDLLPSLQKQRSVIDQIIAGEIDIIIGTQLIAKGHHFPALRLVGIIDGDLGLSQSDPRAGERSFQLINQVAGRAGRAGEQGYAYIQTYMPEHPLMQAILAGDRERFFKNEIETRQKGHIPPFGRMAALIVSSVDMKAAHQLAFALVRGAPSSQRVQILGPAEAPIHLLRKKYRYRILLKTDRKLDLQGYIKSWLSTFTHLPKNVQVTVDIDPYSFM